MLSLRQQSPTGHALGSPTALLLLGTVRAERWTEQRFPGLMASGIPLAHSRPAALFSPVLPRKAYIELVDGTRARAIACHGVVRRVHEAVCHHLRLERLVSQRQYKRSRGAWGGVAGRERRAPSRLRVCRWPREQWAPQVDCPRCTDP